MMAAHQRSAAAGGVIGAKGVCARSAGAGAERAARAAGAPAATRRRVHARAPML
jgi:hypothetical protein